MKVKNAHWEPEKFKQRGNHPSASTTAIENLEVGDIKRIVHDDLQCNYCTKEKNIHHCSLVHKIHIMRKLGWQLEYYHEKQYVLVVRRTK